MGVERPVEGPNVYAINGLPDDITGLRGLCGVCWPEVGAALAAE